GSGFPHDSGPLRKHLHSSLVSLFDCGVTAQAVISGFLSRPWRCGNPILWPTSCAHRLANDASFLVRIMEMLGGPDGCSGENAHPLKTPGAKQNPILSTILTLACTLCTASRWVSVVISLPPGTSNRPMSPSNVNVTSQWALCIIRDALFRIALTSSRFSSATSL